MRENPDPCLLLLLLQYQASPRGFPGIRVEIPAHTSRFFLTAALELSLDPRGIFTCGMTGPQADRWGKGLHRLRQLSKEVQGLGNPEQEWGCGWWVGASLWKPGIEILLLWGGTQPEEDLNMAH